MIRRALLLALACILAAPADAPAQETEPPRRLAEHEQMQFRGVGRLDFGDGYCTATLFDSRHALTAAHCLFDARGRRRPASRLWFRAGFRGSAQQAIRQVRRAVAHPDYRWNGPTATLDEIAVDVALVELDQPLLSTRFPAYRPADLPGQGDPVALVSYGRGRDLVLSLQEPCRVLARQGAVARLDCSAAPGSSGSPVLVRQGDGLRLAGVISARARGVSYASVASEALPALRAALESEGPRRKAVRPGATDASGRKVARPPGAEDAEGAPCSGEASGSC